MNGLGRSCQEVRKLESFADDDVVITGISGRFPLADNMEELKDNLYNKRNCIVRAEDRWPSDQPGLPHNYVGTMKSTERFDAAFFNMTSAAANLTNPETRIIHEVCYEAIVDSGYCLEELRGQEIGVFVGQTDPDNFHMALCNIDKAATFASAISAMSCLVAHKLSFGFDWTGQGLVLDSACSSSASALETAFRRLNDGTLDAAVVGGCSLSTDPRVNIMYSEAGLLSNNQEIRSYDTKADGFLRGEAVVLLFIQRKKDARRIYAKVHNIECIAADYQFEEAFFPSLMSQLRLYNTTYHRVGLDPVFTDYIEGDGSSVPEADVTELNSIDEAFCKGRTSPLLLGTVKNNVGHTKAASALVSIAKVILAFETGSIAPTINYHTPNPKCPSLQNGKIKVVTEAVPYDKSLAAINSFGIGGLISHTVLQRNETERSPDNEENTEKIPKLVLYAATTEKALTDTFSHFHQNSMPKEFYALFNKSAYTPALLSPYRGYTILTKDAPAITSIEYCTTEKREVWYIVTGMGCQWPSMGLDLMQLKVFAESMQRSAEILDPFGIDLFELLNPNNDFLQKDRLITPAFVTIVAIQIALVDVLRALGLEPDGIIGHSTGEIVCSYADGCSTAEQTILSAYYRGASVESTDLPVGSMAAVGLTWEEAKKRCPEGVFPACYNAKDSVTVSGSKESVEKFVEQLKSENIFARVVNAYGYAFHCKTIKAVTGTLRNSLQKVYKSPKQRSKRWLSTSYCEHEWNEPGCQVADANYFCHNLESEVHFREVLTHIPSDAIIIEIGPHFLLKSVVTRDVGSKVSYVGLMKQNANNVEFLLSSVGKLYNVGLDPQVENLYEPISYPVPRGTPMISPLIKWDHSESYQVFKYVLAKTAKRTYKINTGVKDRFLLDHYIDGRSLYPATGYIYLAWKGLSEMLVKPVEHLPICIENFKIITATVLSPTDEKEFNVSILQNSGEFEIAEGGSIVATGKIYSPKQPMFGGSYKQAHFEHSKEPLQVSGSDMYNELRIHGYEYGPAFQGLLEINNEGTYGLVKWDKEWIPFLDSLLLFFGLINDNRDFKLPTGALSVKIDPRIHRQFVSDMQENGFKGFPVTYNPHSRKCAAPGVEIRNLKLEHAPHRSLSENFPVLEKYSFLPYNDECSLGNDERAKCELYNQACSLVVKQIIQHFSVDANIQASFRDIKIDENIKYEEYFPPMDEKYRLLNLLRQILEMSESSKPNHEIEACCQNISGILVHDTLFKSVLDEKHLRPLLDVALENCSGKINITEWCDHGPILITSVQDSLKLYAGTKARYSVVHSQASAIDAENLGERSIQVGCIEENGTIPSEFKCSSHIVMTSFVLEESFSLKFFIEKIVALTKEGGFIFFVHKFELTSPELLIHTLSKTSFTVQSTTEIEKYFSQQNLLIVSKKSYFFGINVYLLRKPSQTVQNSKIHVVNVLDASYDLWVGELKNAMKELQDRESKDLAVLVAQGSSTSGIIGMANCLRQEPGGDKIRCIFTDEDAPQFNLNADFYAEVLEKDLYMNVYNDGCWGSFRHTTLDEVTVQEHTDFAYLECTKTGDLSSLQWVESPPGQKETDEIYHVYYASLNFKDVMIATGKLTLSSFEDSGGRADVMALGLEFSGRSKDGRRIMAMSGGGAIRNTYAAEPLWVYDVPDHWTLEEAATVPVVYTTCYFALILRGELQYGEKILIHSGTGGIGQAAIRIALSMNCEIFTTVGTPEKKEFLLKTFPQLKLENIGSSRDTKFEEMIMKRTQGEGVDMVLNSLADDKFQASVRCLGYHGRFLEIGKYDLHMNSPIGLQMFQAGISFHGVQLNTFAKGTEGTAKMFKDVNVLMNDGIQSGIIQPLKRTVFSKNDVENAFRFMGSGKHIGKILIEVREEESEKLAVPVPMKIKACRKLHLYDTKSYIIVGGLGGFGIELAKWLIQKGAGTVVLTSRYGARTSYHHLCLKRWKESGARVIVSTLNVSKRDEADKLLHEISTKYGPVGGIFNSAVVLKDAFIENQDASTFEEVCAPKALATKNLDELSRSMCPELDMFVCFSSISCGKGNAGQSNYGYANSVMERICEKRKKDGLHGLAIQWGIIGDVGVVHRNMGDDAMIAGVAAQKIMSCLRTLEKFLLQDNPVVSSFVTAGKFRFQGKLDNILPQLAKLFGAADFEQINPDLTFVEMGIDSIVAVELKQVLEMTFDTTLTVQEFQQMKVDDVKRLIEAKEKENKGHLEVRQLPALNDIKLNPSHICLPEEPIIALNNEGGGIPLILIHSNDLLLDDFKKLSQRISRQVFGLRCTKDTPVTSLKDMSLWYLKQLRIFCPGKAVHLASASTAGNLALEMVVQSENQNGVYPSIKTLTILDGSLDLMEASVLTDREKAENVAVHEASDLCEFLSMSGDTDFTSLQIQLSNQPNLETRMNVIRNIISETDSELLQAAETYARKQSLMRFCSPSGKVQKDLTMIEAAEKVLPNDVSAIKSSLADMCQGRITIHRIVGNKEFLIGDSSAGEVATLLNKLCE